MRVLVCGGRDFDDLDMFNEVMDKLYVELGYLDDLTIIHGAARGADTFAGNWAKSGGFYIEEYPADWEKHGKAAGYIRNAQMLEEGKPDLVIAFPGGKGTAMMIDLARKAGVEVREITYEPKEEVEEEARRSDSTVGL